MFKEPSFLKKANLFQPILVVVISIIGGTPMEGANTGKIVLLIILGAAFIVWHVECQRLLNRNRETREHACALKNRSAALYKKTYAALSGEYENFANKLNGESCREAKTDGSRGTTESFNGACLFLCSTIAAALAEYKNSLVFEVLYIQAERRKDQTLLHVIGYAQGEHNNDTPSLLAQPCWMNNYSRNATSAPWFFPARKKCSAAFSGSATSLRRKNTCSIWPFPS